MQKSTLMNYPGWMHFTERSERVFIFYTIKAKDDP